MIRLLYKSADECTGDLVSLRKMMLHLDPGANRSQTARQIQAGKDPGALAGIRQEIFYGCI
ncbi:MAG: hypothetical protein KDK39_13405 [Leptospiraceae bacterium]|nr:hypothetical protein [Leptospiraceae bacterium]